MGQSPAQRSPTALRVLIAGGGVAGLEAMLALRELAGELVDLELLSPEHHFWYRPLSVAEPFGGSRTPSFELPKIAAAAGSAFTPGSLVAIDTDAHAAYTSRGAELPYDVLVVACGTKPTEVLAGALTFRGPSDADRFRELLGQFERGEASRLVFVLPDGAGWSLPLYELALLTAAHLQRKGIHGVELDLVTHEPAPLSLFGHDASTAVAALLAKQGIAFHTERRAVSFADGWLELDEGRILAADRVVALPRLEGHRIAGVPDDGHGFVEVDGHGRVEGLPDVYAAGDITTFPVKQGGVAAQHADVVAHAIAQSAGAEIRQRPPEPVAFAVLLTGHEPLYLRANLAEDREPGTTLASDPLFWPPSKVAARYLAPVLAGLETAQHPAGSVGVR